MNVIVWFTACTIACGYVVQLIHSFTRATVIEKRFLGIMHPVLDPGSTLIVSIIIQLGCQNFMCILVGRLLNFIIVLVLTSALFSIIVMKVSPDFRAYVNFVDLHACKYVLIMSMYTRTEVVLYPTHHWWSCSCLRVVWVVPLVTCTLVHITTHSC